MCKKSTILLLSLILYGGGGNFAGASPVDKTAGFRTTQQDQVQKNVYGIVTDNLK